MKRKVKNSNDNDKDYEQLFIDNIFNEKVSEIGKMSVSDIDKLIKKLSKAKKEAEKNQRIQAEKEAKLRIIEERKQKEAHIKEVTSMDLPLDWENVFNSDKRTQGVHTDSISDALIMSLSELGIVDIEYISSVTGADYKTVICALKGSIFQNPEKWNECFYKGWESADEYLSGNMIRKWKAAKKANEEYNGYFSDNVKAIENVLPPTVATDDIYVTLGSPWVPTDIIDDFILYLFGEPTYYENGVSASLDNIERRNFMELLATRHDEITGTWEIPYKNRYNNSMSVSETFGTARIKGLYILEKTLNMKAVIVTDKEKCLTNASGEKHVINKAETIAAVEKQNNMIKEFQNWVWKNELRRKRLETIFEEKYSCVRKRSFNGDFLEFPEMSPDIELYPYQKDAIARIIFTPNTLLAHDVGSGKTYEMIAAGQKLRQMGLSKKNMYVVPNNIVGQWKNIFLNIYPNANLLCVDPKAFVPSKREKVLENIRDNDYDGIIIAYSCFFQIPLSKEYYRESIEYKKSVIDKVIKDKNKATYRLKNKQYELHKAMNNFYDCIDSMYDMLYFDELGITRLFVDEAHNFKNVPIETKSVNVLGINSKGSKKCQDMLDKVHMIQRKNNGKGVVMATGTPITNSITDIYIMQKYLQSGELALLDIQHFDSWIGMFAEKSNNFEVDVDTSSYRIVTRFSKFHNLPELTSLLSSVADFHNMNNNVGLPEFNGYTDALISKSADLDDYLKKISLRTEEVRLRLVDRKEDNMLKITTDGRKAALDIRLVDSKAKFSFQSKLARCVENVFEIFNKTYFDKGTQLIFCDISTPKSGFNIYSEIKKLLVNMGVSEGTIAFVHDADTESKRKKLFDDVRNGEVRILIGSTAKLGIGVNVQNRLTAIHHLDIPWRPADMTQREGRILRQGNMNKTISIFRYITQGSFDAYSWQLLETKQKIICDILSGSMTERSGADIENNVLNYAEIKALAVGNPLMKKRVEAANELSRFMILQNKLIESRLKLEKELLGIPAKIEKINNTISKCNDDIQNYKMFKKSNLLVTSSNENIIQSDKRKIIRESISEALKSNIQKTKETVLMSYCGFDIVLPMNMVKEKPFVWLSGCGKYYVELGDTEVGNLIRIDNFLENLNGYLNKRQCELQDLITRKSDIERELNNKNSYSDDIEYYKAQVKKLDEELEVNKKWMN